MTERSDAQLLQEYARGGNEAAFREIVVRYTDLAYSAALRQVESADLAADIAQSVFVDLARKAKPVSDRLPAQSSLAGWLHRSTRYAALNHLRDTHRRLRNERQAMEQLLTNSESPADWEQIRPVLDEALDSLDDGDREAVLLRYFKNQDFRAVGLALGVSDDAAQKRVSRAVERLREFFSKRNVTIGASGLVLLISSNAVQAAPVGLVVSISTAAVTAGTTFATTATATAIKTIAMTTAQKTIIGVTLAAAVSTGVYEARQTSTLRSQVQTLQQQQVPLTEQVQQLTRERDEAKNQLAALQGGNSQSKPDEPSAEVLRLRAEVTQLRQQVAQSQPASANANDPFTQDVLALAGRAATLNQYLKQRPDERIPELRFLSENDWLTAAAEAKSDSETDLRKALCVLRSKAKQRLPMAGALDDFTRANNGQLPTDMSQLTPYLKTALKDINLDDATLEAIVGRYKLVQTGNVTNVPPNAWVIVEKAPVDKVYDSRAKFGIGRSTVTAMGPDEYRAPEDRSY